ncbi:hypothetical protein [Staphylospora marina]|uniref:hypothetical protein n=1 Tax=Staphylospora marina TaxID=2490858 RepID=UPI000F5C10DB|nr:hypothetical protein [Staphylospora marina]
MLKAFSFVFFLLFIGMALPAAYKAALHRARFAGAELPGPVRKRLRRSWVFLALFILTLVKAWNAQDDSSGSPAAPAQSAVEQNAEDPASESGLRKFFRGENGKGWFRDKDSGQDADDD